MKHRIALIALIALICFGSTSALAQVAAESWSPELQMKVKAVGAPSLSPDGKLVVYTITDAVMTADKSEFVTQIWLGSADGKENRQLTFNEKSSTNPKWSPDGKAIAFLSPRKENRNNLYLLRLNGGEAEALTEFTRSSISDFEWSPDGKAIAFTMQDPKTEEEEKNEKGKNDYRWVDENIKMSHLYLLPIQKDASGKREVRKLTTGNYSVSSFDWSPDSKRIVFARTASPSPNDWMTSDLLLVEIETGKISSLANTAAAETSPKFSPDGRTIAFLASDIPPRWAQSRTIQIVASTGGQPRSLPASNDGQPVLIGWSADSKRIYFTEAKGTLSQIYSVDLNANRIDELRLPPAVYTAPRLDASGKMLTFVRQTSESPQEVFAASLTTLSPVQISRANADLKLPPIGKTELIRWKSTDGREIEGLLTYPVGYTPGKKVPLLLNIHGGPAGVFQQTFNGGRGIYPIATFSAKGYAVLRPNPRGSSGYGVEFRRANFKDWGGMDYQDLMTGVDKVIEMGVADPNRLGVMGWSYGGFMTSWIVTQTNRFKAASAGAPVTNLTSFTTTTDITAFIPDYFGGQFWDAPEVYQKHSPISFVKSVTTPTMIQHGTADVRVPISQGMEFFNALKARGIPTRMLELPRQPHGPNEPKMMLIVMQSNLEWFEKYLGEKAATGATAP